MMEIPKLVKETVSQLVNNPEVTLFGSRARGDYTKASDWDFLILVDTPQLTRQTKNEIQDLLYELELKTDTVISSLIHTKADWESRGITPLYQIIEKEGVPA
ncbi:MAG: nucleotidyltransferase domain-containing protein [Cyclobacteriaceae bacterium]